MKTDIRVEQRYVLYYYNSDTYLEMMEELFFNRADRICIAKTNDAPLLLGNQYYDPDLTRFLLKYSIYIPGVDNGGYPAFTKASICFDDGSNVKLLLEHESDPAIRRRNGIPTPDIAKMEAKPETVNWTTIRHGTRGKSVASEMEILSESLNPVPYVFSSPRFSF